MKFIFTVFTLICMFSSSLALETIYLHEGWQFRKGGTEEAWKSATVPGNIHTDLLSQGVIKDPFYRDEEARLGWIEHSDWEYQLIFNVSKKTLSYDNIALRFDGIDTYADVYLNGEKILHLENMFIPQEIFPTNLKEGQNELRIYIHSAREQAKLAKERHYVGRLPTTDNDSSKLAAFARKAQYHFGWDWGPRLVTAGIWRPVSIQAWNECRIVDVQNVQKKLSDELAEMELNVQVDKGYKIHSEEIQAKVFVNDNEVQSQSVYPSALEGRFTVPFQIQNPKRWWPNGHGEQYLYKIRLELFYKGKKIGKKAFKTGLRTIELVTKKGEEGSPMYFIVNDVPIFMKGANYIPQDSFTPRVTKKRYQHMLQSTRDANMNMIRVWGGGIYEEDVFYDLCDSLGILVWQDFMFSCAMYPSERAYMQSVKEEAIAQVKRIRNHASLALWCGNNEIELGWQNWWIVFKSTVIQSGKVWGDYKELFHHLLKEVVEKYDPKTEYWRSSPTSNDDHIPSKSEDYGDKHYWGVWAASAPIEKYRDHIGRFMSEYGFQAFPTLNTIKKFSVPEDWEMNSVVMKHHQRHRVGNPQIMKYMNNWYKTPKDFESFVYCSQLLQAEAIKIAIDAHRNAKPYCMGSLYWQLNDCWPAASWASMDYYGEWKALHYFVKKAFATVSVSSELRGNELKVAINSDSLKEINGKLSITWFDFSRKEISSEEKEVSVKANSISTELFFSLSNDLLTNKRNVFGYITFEADGMKTIEEFAYLAKPKDLVLPSTEVSYQIIEDKGKPAIKVTASSFAKNVEVLLDKKITDKEFIDFTISDNYFDLKAGEEKVITISGASFSAEKLKENVSVRSLVDSY